MAKSVVLLSAGLDSTVNFRMALLRGEVLAALTFDYGQRAAAKEIGGAARMCERFGVRHVALAIPWLGKLQATPLTSRAMSLPTPAMDKLEDASTEAGSRAVWIPNRNGILINIAAAHAEAWDAAEVVVGFNAEEAGRFPDNTADYVGAANAALRFSTRNGVRVTCYTQALDKTAVVKLGREIGAPLDLCWSCYDDGARHCGRCESCARLRRAARAAGCEDWLVAQGVLPAASGPRG